MTLYSLGPFTANLTEEGRAEICWEVEDIIGPDDTDEVFCEVYWICPEEEEIWPFSDFLMDEDCIEAEEEAEEMLSWFGAWKGLRWGW